MATYDPDSDQDKSTEWAEFRTDLAEDRNIMAMERTFAGWMRTAFAAIGIGLAFKAVFGEFDPPWLAKAIATVFILAGGMAGGLRRTAHLQDADKARCAPARERLSSRISGCLAWSPSRAGSVLLDGGTVDPQ